MHAHPVTGEPALYLDLDRATHIDAMPVDEGRTLLQSLQDHAERHAPRYVHDGDRTTSSSGTTRPCNTRPAGVFLSETAAGSGVT